MGEGPEGFDSRLEPYAGWIRLHVAGHDMAYEAYGRATCLALEVPNNGVERRPHSFPWLALRQPTAGVMEIFQEDCRNAPGRGLIRWYVLPGY